MNGYQNQDLPFGRLVDELSPAGEPARNPIFQVMFFFLAVPTVSKFSNLTVKPFEAYAGTARYDLLVSLWDKPQGIGGFFEYNTALFKPETIAQLVDSYRLLAGAITADPDQRLSDLSR
jgi:non-ribosomal peptide synthetase component F